jgi:hypothetical protein
MNVMGAQGDACVYVRCHSQAFSLYFTHLIRQFAVGLSST